MPRLKSRLPSIPFELATQVPLRVPAPSDTAEKCQARCPQRNEILRNEANEISGMALNV